MLEIRVLLALLAILALRLGCAEFLLRRIQQLPDTQLYQAYAQSLLRGDGYQVGNDGARRAPGYPGFLALTWWAAGCQPLDPDPAEELSCRRRVLWVQAGLSTLTCWLVFHLSVHLVEVGIFPATSPWWALASSALDPYANVMCGMVLSETVFTTLLVAAGLMGLRLNFQPAGGPFRAIALGLLCGIAVLVRPSSLLLPPLAVGGWLWGSRTATRWKWAAWAAAGLVVVMTPWTARNAYKYGRFIPTTLNVGESLYDGWNPRATGASNMEFVETQTPAELRDDEPARDRFWRRAAVDWAREHPGRVVELAGIKFLRFWSPWPNEPSFQRPVVVAATTALVTPVFAAALVGSWICRRRRWLLCFFWLPAVYFCGLHLAFVSSVRYRVPAMPFLHVLAGAGMVWAAAWIASRFKPRRA